MSTSRESVEGTANGVLTFNTRSEVPKCVSDALEQKKITQEAEEFGSKCIGEMKVKITKQDKSKEEVTIVSISGVPRSTVQDLDYVLNFEKFYDDVYGKTQAKTEGK